MDRSHFDDPENVNFSKISEETYCYLLFGYDEHWCAPLRLLNLFKDSYTFKSFQFLLACELVYLWYWVPSRIYGFVIRSQFYCDRSCIPLSKCAIKKFFMSFELRKEDNFTLCQSMVRSQIALGLSGATFEFSQYYWLQSNILFTGYDLYFFELF